MARKPSPDYNQCVWVMWVFKCFHPLISVLSPDNQVAGQHCLCPRTQHLTLSCVLLYSVCVCVCVLAFVSIVNTEAKLFTLAHPWIIFWRHASRFSWFHISAVDINVPLVACSKSITATCPTKYIQNTSASFSFPSCDWHFIVWGFDTHNNPSKRL